MVLDGALAQVRGLRDLAVRAAREHPLQHFHLPRRQFDRASAGGPDLERVRALPRFLGQRGPRVARGCVVTEQPLRAQVGDDLLQVGRLGEVSRGTRRKHAALHPRIGGAGEHHDPRRRELAEKRLQAREAVRVREFEVEQHAPDVRAVLAIRVEGRLQGAGLVHPRRRAARVVRLQQRAQAEPQQVVVVDDEDAIGRVHRKGAGVSVGQAPKGTRFPRRPGSGESHRPALVLG